MMQVLYSSIRYPQSQKQLRQRPEAKNNTLKPRFSGHTNHGLQEQQIQELAACIQQQLGPESQGHTAEKALTEAIRQNRPLALPQGYVIEYGVAYSDGRVESPYSTAKSLLPRSLRQGLTQDSKRSKPTPFLIKIATPETEQAFTRTFKNVLRSDKNGFAHTYTAKSGVENHNVILTDLIENLVSGNHELLSDQVRQEILPALLGNEKAGNPLGGKYQVLIPGNKMLTQQINNSPAFQRAREKRMGLDLAKKVYSENQKVEYGSVIMSLIIGGLSEPTINHFFHDGGPMASIARTTILSGVDILGNILSVMGMVSDRLESRELKLSLKTVFGKHGLWNVLKNPRMEGAAGPDIKQGIKVGLQGGVLGVMTNIPAASIMSMNNADVASRSVIGGIGAASSGVAIPFEVRESKESLVHSIRELIKRGVIKLPNTLKTEQDKKNYIDRLAFKEMNSRLGYASSIKAMNPLPLIGTGTAILGAEKLGIPREYTQTAYMGLAPVMHNFLRLVYSGWEKAYVIPHRLKKMEQLVNATPEQAFSQKQRTELDNTFLSGFDSTLDKWLTSTVPLLTSAGVVFGAEFLYFAHTWQKSKQEKASSKGATPGTKPIVPNASEQNTATAPVPQASPLPASMPTPVQGGGNPFPQPSSAIPMNQQGNFAWGQPGMWPLYTPVFSQPAYPGYQQFSSLNNNFPLNGQVPFRVVLNPGFSLMPYGLPQQNRYNSPV